MNERGQVSEKALTCSLVSTLFVVCASTERAHATASDTSSQNANAMLRVILMASFFLIQTLSDDTVIIFKLNTLDEKIYFSLKKPLNLFFIPNENLNAIITLITKCAITLI